jgi:hypothetical protein
MRRWQRISYHLALRPASLSSRIMRAACSVQCRAGKLYLNTRFDINCILIDSSGSGKLPSNPSLAVFLVLCFGNAELVDNRMARQIGASEPRAQNRVCRTCNSHNAIIGHSLNDFLLKPLDESWDQGVSPNHNNVGEKSRPQANRQALQALYDEIGYPWLP